MNIQLKPEQEKITRLGLKKSSAKLFSQNTVLIVMGLLI